MHGTPGSAYLQSEPNATELPSSAPGCPELIELQAYAPSPTPTRAEEHIATTPDCRPRAPAPSPTPTRAEHLAGLRLRALARRRAPKRTSHYTCRCERVALHVKRYPGSSHDVKTCGLLLLQYGRWRALAKGAGWTVLNSQRSLWVQTKTAHHDTWRRRFSAPEVALTRPPLSRFALHLKI